MSSLSGKKSIKALEQFSKGFLKKLFHDLVLTFYYYICFHLNILRSFHSFYLVIQKNTLKLNNYNNMKTNKHLLTGLCCCLISSLAAQDTELRLPDMDLSRIYQPYGTPMKNKAVTGEPLRVAGVPYSSGVGVQAGSRMKLSLHGKASTFSCKVGVNDQALDYKDSRLSKIPMTDGTMIFYDQQNDQKQYLGIGKGSGEIEPGSVLFSITADGKELYNSGTMRQGEPAKTITLPVDGISILELIADDAADGISGDHANWLDPVITYFEIQPTLTDPDFQGTVDPMPTEVEKQLRKQIGALSHVSLPLPAPGYDWLLQNEKAQTTVSQANQGKDIVLSNGLVSRVFRVFPNLATIDIQNLMTGQNMLRAVSNEGTLTIDGRLYQLGGLDGQPEFGYTQYKWVDQMKPFANSFRVVNFEVSDITPHIQWNPKRWALEKDRKPSGKQLTFTLEGPGELKGVQVRLHYALYDGLPCISKWFEVENRAGVKINLDEFVLEQLAMAEPESPVEAKSPEMFRKPNIHVESDWGFLGFIEKIADKTEHWSTDPRYTSQCNYPLITPCLLEVKLPMGPDEQLPSGQTFSSFRTWIMPFDSEDRDRKGLFIKRMYRAIAPWTTENPIFMHCTSSDPKVVKEAIDQCQQTGYEMVILSFGSGLNMEDESDANYAKFRELRDYAHQKGIELGGYSLLSSRWISDEVDVINPETGKRGGMIFGSSPCLCSDWGYDYFRKIKQFYEKTGMTVFENDGSYPGNVCASAVHTHHKGLKDSQWKQRKQIANLYQWMCENGIYMNIPDYGYILNGGNKVGIGYREVNWSLPRERQLVLGRQVMYDGLWERLPGMCWTFVPLTQYHGGGEAATLEPLNDHLADYKAHMIQNYGTGVQACYRGHRLYDTEKTKQTVVEVINWYKKYRELLNSEIIHLRRPDGKDWDGIMHIAPGLKEKGMVMLYNPTDTPIRRTIQLPLYYTGLSTQATVKEQGGKANTYTLKRDYTISLDIDIPAKGYNWYTIE